MGRNIAIAVLIACLAFMQAGAQAGPPSHQILSDPNLFAEAHIKGLDSQVHLSEEQKEKLRPLFVAEGQRLIAIMNDRSFREEQRQQMIQQLHEETAAKVASMLTPSQRKNHDNSSKPKPPTQQATPRQI